MSEAKLLEYVPIPELLSPGGILTKKESSSCSSSVINASPRSQHGTGCNDKEPLKFHAKFTRRFIEMDDEMVSVMSGNCNNIHSNLLNPNIRRFEQNKRAVNT
jgi:hypothetical protein